MSEKPSNLAEILTLLRQQYGRNELIPAEELARYGYQKVEIPENKGGGFRFVSIALLHRESRELEGKSNPWIEKRNNQPFEVIKIDTIPTSRVFRSIEWHEKNKLARLIDDLDPDSICHPTSPEFPRMKKELTRLLPENAAFFTLMDEFYLFLTQYSVQLSDEEIGYTLQQLFDSGLINFSVIWESIDFYSFVDETNDGNILPKENAEELLRELEILKAKSMDYPQQRIDFTTQIRKSTEIVKDLEDVKEKTPKLRQLMEEQKIKGDFDFALFWWSEFLSYLYGDLIDPQRVLNAESFGEILTYLNNLNLNQVLADRVKQLNIEITQASVEEKKVLSGKLKVAKQHLKEATKIKLGFQDYFDFPVLFSTFYQRQVNQLKSYLTRGREEGQDTIYLDGRINEKRDRNPGKISGDCTANQPLPFLKPDVPLYNIKVHNREQKHVGNIYLALTTDIEGRSIWHLDAIQIPIHLKWSEAIGTIIQKLAIMARKKGIKAITVNYNEMLISNYDFVREGVNKFWLEQSQEWVYIAIPEHSYGGKYSQLQGTGQAKILWEEA